MTRGPNHPDDHDRPNGSDLRRASVGQATRKAIHRILIVSASADRRESLARAARHDDSVCVPVESIGAAMDMLGRTDLPGGESRRFGMVIVDVPACSALALKFVRDLEERHVPSVIVCPVVSFDDAVEAMRAGAADILTSNLKGPELHARLRAALSGRRAGNGMVDAANRAIDDACHAPASPTSVTPAEPADDEAAEFERLVRCELDVEALLRTALEFILAKCGSTNAAVFLPSTTGDYSLGAYVNYSCPKDTAEVLLDHLANVAAPRLEGLESLVVMNTAESIQRHLGEGCQWIDDCQVAAFACREQGECLALFMLFRERGKPFEDRMMETLAMVSTRFAAQLARVIRIHHRHLPRDQWGALGDPTDGGGDDLLA